MKCTKYPEREAAGICSYSGKPFCEEELVEIDGKMYGKDYASKVFEESKQQVSSIQSAPSKWYDNKAVVALLCILFFPVGLYALWKSNTISKGWKVGVTAVIAIFAIGVLGSDDDFDSPTSSSRSNSTEPSTSYVETGEVLSTRYFDVTVNSARVQSFIDTGNRFTNLTAGQEELFVVLNVTFRNTDNESRMILDGELIINYNGQDYRFDKTETIMVEGWGLFFDQINPLTSRTTNLIFKIPEGINGPAYYRPGRASRRDLINLGNFLITNDESNTSEIFNELTEGKSLSAVTASMSNTPENAINWLLLYFSNEYMGEEVGVDVTGADDSGALVKALKMRSYTTLENFKKSMSESIERLGLVSQSSWVDDDWGTGMFIEIGEYEFKLDYMSQGNVLFIVYGAPNE